MQTLSIRRLPDLWGPVSITEKDPRPPPDGHSEGRSGGLGTPAQDLALMGIRQTSVETGGVPVTKSKHTSAHENPRQWYHRRLSAPQ
mmetsp:Transcript_64103/g.105827  ORF Transcript_64103/g.105827 Transcript_64103/m.105827 type:complete len:87 (-) Transcript_64103:1700-1960(-)